jgi:DNA-binding transcriptional MerR regulator
MNHFSIKDIEHLTGIKSHTLRIWEQRYGIPHPKRTSTNIRYYDDDDLKLLLNVSLLNRHGHKISRLTKMSRAELEKLALSYALNSTDTSLQLDAMMAAMFQLDESSFDKILSNHLVRFGLETTMLDLFFPFLKRVGVLWQTGQVNPAFEHFMSNLIRQKIIVAIDAVHGENIPAPQQFILFLPEGEGHELGLLFANYVLRARGHNSIYLGQNLPYTDLEAVIGQVRGDYIMTVLTSAVTKMTVQEFIDKLAKRYNRQTILITGFQVTVNRDLVLPENVVVMDTFRNFLEFVEKLGNQEAMTRK